MPYLSRKRIRELHKAAAELGLADSRAALFAGMEDVFHALPKSDPSPSAQMYIDLHRLNSIRAAGANEACFFELWLETAHHLKEHDARAGIFLSARDEVKEAREHGGSLPFVFRHRPWALWITVAGLAVVAWGAWYYWRMPQGEKGRVDANPSGVARVPDVDGGGSDGGVMDAGVSDGGAKKRSDIPFPKTNKLVCSAAGSVFNWKWPEPKPPCGEPPDTATVNGQGVIGWTIPSPKDSSIPLYCECPKR